MTLTELRYIAAVARERHFGRAAAACFVSQPTLSVAVKKLEEELGVTLFERHKHDVTITPIGERIVEQARLVLDQAKHIRDIADAGKDELKGELRLGVIYTVGPYLVPKLIPLLHRKAPDLTIILDEDFTGDLAGKLRHGDIDMALLSLPFSMPGVDVVPVYREPFLVALPRGHTLAARKSIRADDLSREVLLLLRAGNCFRDQVIETCPSCWGGTLSRDSLQKTLEGSSIETIRQMVAAGSGVTVLPVLSAQDRGGINRMLEFRPFAKPVPERTIALASRANYPKPKLVQLLRDAIAACPLDGVRKLSPAT